MSTANMQYRLLALDIDGTLVPEHTNSISPKVLEAIQKAKKHLVVSLVSARARADQQIIIDALGLGAGYHVLENGTKVLNPNGEIEYCLYLPYKDVLIIQKIAKPLCDSIGFCVDGKWLQKHPDTTEDVVTTLSIIAKRKNAEQIATMIKNNKFEYSITVGNHWSDTTLAVVLLSHKNASKGGGLRYLQKVLHIQPEETIAIGDGASDVPMLQQAGLKVAMGNGEAALKKVATVVTAAVFEDGVAKIIEEYVVAPTEHSQVE